MKKRFIKYAILLLLPGICFANCLCKDSQLKINHQYYIFVRNMPPITGGIHDAKLISKCKNKYVFKIINQNTDKHHSQYVKISLENVLGENI